MKINKAIICLVTLMLFSCSFVSCGDSSKSSDDKKASVSEQSETKSAEESKIIGTWELDSEYYEGMEFEGIKPTSCQLKLTEDNKAVQLIEMDCSESLYLTDKKLYIDGYGYKIKSFDRKELVIDCGSYGEIAFVRTSKSSSKFGEYNVPDEFEWGEEAKIVFEENEKSRAKVCNFGEYYYDDKSGEMNVEWEDDDDDNGPATIEFLDEDTILVHGSDGEDRKMFRVK